MTYPALKPHLVDELEWIKQRYDALLIRQTSSIFTPVQKQAAQKELVQIDDARTQIYLQHIQPTLQPQPATYER